MNTRVHPPEPEEPLLTPDELAAFLRVPVATIQSWRTKRTGPRGYRVGKHVRYRRADVEAWLERRASSEALDAKLSLQTDEIPF